MDGKIPLRLSGKTMNEVADYMGVNRRTFYLYMRGYVPMSDNFQDRLNDFLADHGIKPVSADDSASEVNYKVASAVMLINKKAVEA